MKHLKLKKYSSGGNAHVESQATLASVVNSDLKRLIRASCLLSPNIGEDGVKDQILSNINSSTHTSWLTQYLEYLINDALLEDKELARKIMTKDKKYTSIQWVLYRKHYGGPWLKCLLP